MLARLVMVVLLAGSIAACAPIDAKVSGEVRDQPPSFIQGVLIREESCEVSRSARCPLDGEIRANVDLDLRASADPDSAVTGAVAAGEWIEVISTERREEPVRGVVSKISPGKHRGFAVGDTVYRINRRGDGCINVGAGGQLGVWCEGDNESGRFVVDWRKRPSDIWRTTTVHVRVQRANGQTGWVEWLGWGDANDAFACASNDSREIDCPPPTTGGVILEEGACAPSGCFGSRWLRAAGPVELLEWPAPGARVGALLEAGEPVQVRGSQSRAVPVRGVVRSVSPAWQDRAAIGDIVYRTQRGPTDCFNLKTPRVAEVWVCAINGQPDGLVVAWEALPQHRAAKQGYYVHVARVSGDEGWVKGVDGFTCTSPESREEDCAPPDADAVDDNGDDEP